MPLNETEWDLVRCLVRDHLLAAGDPQSRLNEFLPRELVADLRFPSSPSDLTRQLVTRVRRGPLTPPDPPPLRLLNALATLDSVRVIPDIQKVDEYRHRLQADLAEAARDDPFTVSVLTGGQEAFIDRVELRTTLRDLVDNPERLVLRVKGDPTTGRSYTFQLIQHLAGTERFNFRPVRVILDENSTAADVVYQIGSVVSRDFATPPPTDDPSKWIRYAAIQLVRTALDAQCGWWFVLDECNALPPSSDVFDLISQLALEMFNQTRGLSKDLPWPRLVLLGYGDEFPVMPWDLRGRVSVDSTRSVDDEDLRTFFHTVFSSRADRDPAATADDALLSQVEETVALVQLAVDEHVRQGGSYMQGVGLAAEEFIRG